jgi:hypothetical protein
MTTCWLCGRELLHPDQDATKKVSLCKGCKEADRRRVNELVRRTNEERNNYIIRTGGI